MAGIVERVFSYQVTAERSGTPVPGARFAGFNQADSLIIDETLNNNGRFGSGATDTPINVEAQEYSVVLTGGPGNTTTLQRNPYDLRFLNYGDEIFQFGKDFVQASQDAVFAATDSVITESNQATVNAYPGITFTHGSDLITLASGTWNPQRLYDRATSEAIDNPQADIVAFIESVDGVNFVQSYSVLINGAVAFDGGGVSYSGDWETQNGGSITDMTVANLLLDGPSPQTSLVDVNVTGVLTFDVAGTYTLNGCTINEVVNTSGGAVTINAVSSTITTNTGPNITINNAVPVVITAVDSTTGLPVQNARVFLEEDPGGADIIAPATLTDVNGQVSTTFNFTSDQDVTGFVRKGTELPVYRAAPITGTITAIGFSQTISLIPDE